MSPKENIFSSKKTFDILRNIQEEEMNIDLQDEPEELEIDEEEEEYEEWYESESENEEISYMEQLEPLTDTDSEMERGESLYQQLLCFEEMEAEETPLNANGQPMHFNGVTGLYSIRRRLFPFPESDEESD